MKCGLLRRSFGRFLGNTRFYEEQYENYYGRPGAARYDRDRYAAMAEWMKLALDDFKPRSILDVGCGAGWLMAATATHYLHATIEGAEPSLANAEKARKAGFVVYSTRLGSGETLPKKYDLIYANNVLQHVIDPIGFFSDILYHLSSSGRVVFILPDAAEPSNEMMWCDHNFSFRATDLATLAERTGCQVMSWQANPANNNLLNKQLVVLRREGETPGRAPVPQNLHSNEELFTRRSQYLMRWRYLDDELTRRIHGHRRVFNFGGSMWTWLLAGYCPKYWSTVAACLVDGEHGQTVDKKMVPPSEISFGREDCIVLGVNPLNQGRFAERLRSLGPQVITWCDWINV